MGRRSPKDGERNLAPTRSPDPGREGSNLTVNRSAMAVVVAAALAAVLVCAYLAAGGASYEPTAVRDPCHPRAWRSPDDLQKIAEQFTLSALDGAACELGVSREVLARALVTDESRAAFAERYKIDDARFDDAVHAGLERGVDDAEKAGAVSPIVALTLHEIARNVPIDEAIKLIQDARPLFDNAQGLLGSLPGLLDGAGGLLPSGLSGLVPQNLP